MKNILFLLVSIICLGCSEESEQYINKNVYDITVGDSCMIYYAENTCCMNCIYNENDLDNVKLQNILTVGEGDRDCIGCNIQSAYVVRGIKSGIDTFNIRSVPVPEAKKCKEDTLHIEIHHQSTLIH